ncbi:hypothetical protein SAMN06297129_1573 [Pseudooceanicola antarcticus]|uniref:Uncharacterized protein n=1 Tax=Pseudooceanicola antarcticus TaxID=1247613 RepID=A0A285ILA1_9RHOB|nr:hypothetical protein [Pseudooceanicola antarcticus]PJE28607.1 hypothetical protein CVM39_08995 [Pseudooceanicola antarcticus]SNY48790.1 hypothetical protein SAMN06297129_1573 [Pseudooceanicola antarcticus]
MTALEKYQRLEAAALWREGPQAQRRDVIISIGEATITIADLKDQPLTHWSIAALTRANPGALPALYHPDGDPEETLELAADEAQMIDALEQLRSAVARRRPHRGRLRMSIIGGFAAGILALGLFWLPGALKGHALSVLPQVKRDEIGARLFAEVQGLTGAPCVTPGGTRALSLLSARVTPEGRRAPELHVVRSGLRESLHLPGNILILGRAVVEGYEDPEIPAGFVVAEMQRAHARDPMDRLLDEAGIGAVLRLLTTGSLAPETLSDHARSLLSAEPVDIGPAALLEGFQAAGIQSRPYAFARDITGETVLPLIEGDPYPSGAPEPVMRDADWLRLQAICGG